MINIDECTFLSMKISFSLKDYYKMNVDYHLPLFISFTSKCILFVIDQTLTHRTYFFNSCEHLLKNERTSKILSACQQHRADSEALFKELILFSVADLPSKPGGCAAHVRNKKGNSNSQQCGSENFAKQQERSRRRYVQHQAPTSKDNSGSLEKVFYCVGLAAVCVHSRLKYMFLTTWISIFQVRCQDTSDSDREM